MIEVDLMNIEIGKDVSQLTSLTKSNRKEAEINATQQASLTAAKQNQATAEASQAKAEKHGGLFRTKQGPWAGRLPGGQSTLPLVLGGGEVVV